MNVLGGLLSFLLLLGACEQQEIQKVDPKSVVASPTLSQDVSPAQNQTQSRDEPMHSIDADTLSAAGFETDTNNGWITSAVQKMRPTLQLPEGCSSYDVDAMLEISRGSAQAYSQKMKSFVERCHGRYKKANLGVFWSAISDLSIEYSYLENRKIKNISFIDPDGHRVRAHLALQDGNTPRPLIIIKCGIYCNLGGMTVRKAIMQLFDASPFHILFLTGITGSDFEIDNNVMSVGGLDEGRQIIHIAQYLRSPYFFASQRVSSIHVYGYSLGGHALFYSALYNDYGPRHQGKPLISSFYASCPVVDLEKSVKRIFRKGIVGKLVSTMFWDQISEVMHQVPIIRKLLPPESEKLPVEDIPKFIEDSGFEYYKDKTKDPNWGMPPIADALVQTKEDFWYVNRFQNYAHLVKSPVFVWASENDPVVTAKENTNLILDVMAHTGQDNFTVLKTPIGGHCLVEAPTDWGVITSLMRNYFLANSPEFVARKKNKELELNLNKRKPSFKLKGLERRKKLEWKAFTAKRVVELSQESMSPDCEDSKASNHVRCTRLSKLELSFADVGLSSMDVPSNDVEAQALSRYLNTSRHVLDVEGNFVGVEESAARIRWASYE